MVVFLIAGAILFGVGVPAWGIFLISMYFIWKKKPKDNLLDKDALKNK